MLRLPAASQAIREDRLRPHAPQGGLELLAHVDALAGTHNCPLRRKHHIQHVVGVDHGPQGKHGAAVGTLVRQGGFKRSTATNRQQQETVFRRDWDHLICRNDDACAAGAKAARARARAK